MPPFVRSSIAVFAGFMVMIVLSAFVFTPILLRIFGRPSAPLSLGYLALNALFTLLAVGLGGYATAVVARVRPIEHAAALGGIVFLLGWLQYRLYSGPQPMWYIWFMGIVPPFCVLTAASFYKPGEDRG